MSNPHALMVGAGIGGLAAALALTRSGWRVTLVEQADAPAEVGAGLQLSPNATRVLAALDVLQTVEARACRPEALEMRSGQNARLLMRMPLGEALAAQYGAPYLHIHRADLHNALLQALRAQPQVDCVFGARVMSVGQDAARASIRTEDGRELHADVLIGADGIRSVVRAALFGAEDARFTGCVAWRGVIPASRLQGANIPRIAALWLGPGAHFVHYYLRGGELLNFVAVSEREGWEVESWTQKGDQRELLAEFGHWHEPVRRIVHAADPDACFKWALFDRPPMPRWSQGRISLLGDACHATLPFMAQGAAMAIEDAAVLATCLQRGADVPAALHDYEQRRLVRTAAIQNTSRMNKTLYHLRGPAAWARDRMMPGLSSAFAKRLTQIFAYDALSQ